MKLNKYKVNILIDDNFSSSENYVAINKDECLKSFLLSLIKKEFILDTPDTFKLEVKIIEEAS